MRLHGRWRTTVRPLLCGLLLLVLCAPPSAAQTVPVTRDSVTLVPGPQFNTTSWIRWLGTVLFGSRYRSLWSTPITVPVLDLSATGGGLRVTGEGTGRDTALLYLEGADGSGWVFQPLERTEPRTAPRSVVPASVSSGVITDLTSGRHPAGPLVASTLADAAGVPNQGAWLVVLTPDTALGGFDTGDKGRAGYLLRREPPPSVDSSGPVESGSVATSLTVLHRTLEDPAERVDAGAVLQASIFDVFVGNLNPRFLEWRWEAVRSEGGILWRPLGRFRDGALARYDGLVISAAQSMQPELAMFGPDYPGVLTGTPDQVTAYRWLLGSLGRPEWDSIAALLQQRLTDSIIEAAVARMPAPYRDRMGRSLTKTLRQRRDHLPIAVDRMYRRVREEAEVRGTTSAEAVAVEWLTPDSLMLRLGGVEQVFAAGETKGVTLFSGGGTDTLRFIGDAGGAPPLRIAPPPGATLVVEGDAAGGAATVYGEDEGVIVTPPGAIRLQSKSVTDALARLDSTGVERTEGRKQYRPSGWFELTSGVGLLLGAGVIRTDWSGEARPYRNQLQLRAGYGTESGNGVVQLLGDFRWAHSPLQLHLDAIASGVGAIYFYGFGNETPGNQADSYYRAGRNLYGIAPSLVVPLSDRISVGSGLAYKSVETPLDTSLFIGVDQPYGTPSFGETGLTGQFVLDTRDVTGAPRHGVLAKLEGAWYPVIQEGSGGFGTITGSVSTYLTPPWWDAMTVAARISGTATAGTVPYFESAFVGGGGTVRGLPQGRYNGNQAVFGNLDLRLRVSRVQFVLPWDFGVLGLADLGRVFVTGEHSDVWHPSFGGGLWAALLDRSLAASLNVATGAGKGVFINGGGGFTF